MIAVSKNESGNLLSGADFSLYGLLQICFASVYMHLWAYVYQFFHTILSIREHLYLELPSFWANNTMLNG